MTVEKQEFRADEGRYSKLLNLALGNVLYGFEGYVSVEMLRIILALVGLFIVKHVWLMIPQLLPMS